MNLTGDNDMEQVCENCGQPFVPKRADAAYCGHSCRQQAYLKRKTESRTDNPYDVGTVIPEKQGEKKTKLSVTSNESYPSTAQAASEEAMAESLTRETTAYYSPFLNYIEQRLNDTDHSPFLTSFEMRYPSLSYWINTRYLFLVESLLALSERKAVELDDLKDICNAFHLLLHCGTFQNMPVVYPYIREMNKYYQIIRQFCKSAQEETVLLRITRKTKAELLATRFELAQRVAKVGFDQLDFGDQ